VISSGRLAGPSARTTPECALCHAEVDAVGDRGSWREDAPSLGGPGRGHQSAAVGGQDRGGRPVRLTATATGLDAQQPLVLATAALGQHRHQVPLGADAGRWRGSHPPGDLGGQVGPQSLARRGVQHVHPGDQVAAGHDEGVGDPPDVGGAMATSGHAYEGLRGSPIGRTGRRVRLPVDLHRASRYLDEGVPDAERALQMRGTSLLGTTKSGALVELVASAGWIDERMADARALARHAIGDAVGRWSGRSAAIVMAIVIGDRAGLDDDVERRLQEAGTYHVIAISGGNIAILAGLLIAGFRLAGLLGRTAMLASIVLLAAYGRLVGGDARERVQRRAALVRGAGRKVDNRHERRAIDRCAAADQTQTVLEPATPRRDFAGGR